MQSPTLIQQIVKQTKIAEGFVLLCINVIIVYPYAKEGRVLTSHIHRIGSVGSCVNPVIEGREFDSVVL
ncbi:unnamed protein product [Trifolium pratense]|uniref:Uncharacterized protein n=1 Tax=Trifolium pratense TaxID=57577 RepID=A0ACB0LPN9_TRIPR|nr:unnamed protein product [Trifolium pratense]